MTRPIVNKSRAARGRLKARREAIRQLRQGQRPQSGLPDPNTPAAQAITQTTRILSHQMKPRAALFCALLQHAHLGTTEERRTIFTRIENLVETMLDDEYIEASRYLKNLELSATPRLPGLDIRDR